LELIYISENDEIKKLIDNEMLVVQKKIMESTKASSGFMNRFWSSAKVNVVTINDVWVKLGKNN
jgi:hypothetical protein